MTIISDHLYQLTLFTSTDIQGLIELSASVGWDYDAHEIETIMTAGRIFGHKNKEGKIVSSAAIIPYDTNVASIGMVIVHDQCRGYGLGKIVTQACIDSVSEETAIMLVATKEGEPLYNKMGFTTVAYVHKYLADKFVETTRESDFLGSIDEFQEQDFEQLVKLDAVAFGDSRRVFLHKRIQQSQRCVVVKNQHNEMIGYGLTIAGPIYLLFGPIVAPNKEIAHYIINELARGYQGKVRIDCPSIQKELSPILEQSGFSLAATPPVMIRNAKEMPLRNQTLFALAAQAFG
ncbi:GNAT family N-acetyltransferase [Lysinibacillus cavernae]|uniref:GNAT family N-acetyltransferase n=1 Tax=Lysinibacillus cavernae TaxID=2666135 RepID=UPI001E2BD91E|nr:GNAT family N-acetyltransferase [Lysinibacillus cavernae]